MHSKSRTHDSRGNEIWGNCGCCWVPTAVVWSLFSMFYDSFPVSLAISHSLSHPAAAAYLPAERREGKGDFWYSLSYSCKETQWGSWKKSEVTPIHTAFLSIWVILFLSLDKEISLKQWPNGHGLSSAIQSSFCSTSVTFWSFLNSYVKIRPKSSW